MRAWRPGRDPKAVRHGPSTSADGSLAVADTQPQVLVVGGGMKIVTSTYDVIQAWKSLQSTAPGVSSALGKVGKAAGIAGAALVALQIADQVADRWAALPPEIEKTTAALLGFDDGFGFMNSSPRIQMKSSAEFQR